MADGNDANDASDGDGGDDASDTSGLADGRYTAVLDRFETTDPAGDGDRLAVLLLESGESVVAERTVPAWRLPADARRQDAVLELVVKNGFVVSTEFDPESTERRTESAQSRFDRLAERPDDESDES
ncbi:DUF3006 domain-containing protein [Halorussus limi]|uniref:DUF3006 domain-containing protein n=1 Tax=Halorussus limi TaxID=2938695 RepID=A0A8U0HSX0_9EURY|nr:DUF3006 domain-containing protein [Halorussus limi]UPV73853.1 DUF3006 domain-containing protein [Halorussus limi]